MAMRFLTGLRTSQSQKNKTCGGHIRLYWWRGAMRPSVWSVSYLARELKSLLGLEEGLGDLVQGGEQVRLFKGIVSRDEFLFESPKVKQYFLKERLWFSKFSVVFLWRKSKMKFLLGSSKSLTNCEIPSNNPLQRACSGFLIASCAFKIWCGFRINF